MLSVGYCVDLVVEQNWSNVCFIRQAVVAGDLPEMLDCDLVG